MNEIWRYSIRIGGQIDREAINRTSPVKLTIARVMQAETLCELACDQAGLIGLLRHLHQRGIVIIELQRYELTETQGEQDD